MSAEDLPDEFDAEAAETATKKRRLIERLLSPESLQKMMASGGGLLVLGFVIWLWKIGLFANPITVAAIVGGVTLGVMGVGILVHKYTRYELAGNGLTMLGGLALPLNLWLYDAQELITLEGGGHLWVPAAICCGIYAGVAWLIRDSRFVYALTGGVVMTGMLFMADSMVNCFWYLLPQVTFLLSVGWACMVAERQFPINDGDFSRINFGKAFHRSGIVILCGGLLLLLGGQLLSTLTTVFPVMNAPLIATLRSQKVWASILLLGSTVGFAVQHLLRHRQSRYGMVACGMGVWTSLALVDVLGIRPTLSHLLIGASALVTVWNVIAATAGRASADVPSDSPNGVTRLLEGSHILSVLFFFTAGAHFVGQFLLDSGTVLLNTTGWTLVIQLASSTLAIWTTAGVVRVREDRKGLLSPPRALTLMGSVTSVLTLTTLVLVTGWSSIWSVAGVLLAVPAVAAVGSISIRRPALQGTLRLITRTSQPLALVMLAAFAFDGQLLLTSPHWTVCCVLLTSAVNWYLAAASAGRAADSDMGHIAGVFALWQGLVALGVDSSHSLVVTPTVIGIAMALFRKPLLWKASDSTEASRRKLETAHNILVLLGNGAGILMAMNRVLAHEPSIGLVPMLLIQLAGATIVGLMTKQAHWRNTFRVTALGLVLTTIAAINGLVDMSWAHRSELFSILTGTALLVMGYIAWAREDAQKDGMATIGLTIGSLLVGVPLAIGLVQERLANGAVFSGWGLFHEVGVIVAGIVLLGSGLLCRVRATTLVGSSLFAVHLASLVILIHWPEQLLNVSVLMMLGGATFFVTGVLLSIYRDRLLVLPGQIREGQGLFQVLKWR